MDEERDEMSAEEAAEEIVSAAEQPQDESAAQAEMPARQEDAESTGEESSTEEVISEELAPEAEAAEEAETAADMALADEDQAEAGEAEAVEEPEAGEAMAVEAEAESVSDVESVEDEAVEEAAEDEMAEAELLEMEPVAEEFEQPSYESSSVTADDEDDTAARAVARVVAEARAEDSAEMEAEVEPEPEPEDGRAWYVVHCYSGYENKVRHNLEQRIESMGMKDQIFDVVVPTEEEIEVKEGKRRTVERRVFPGYILVNMIMGEEPWYVVRNTPGVTSFVGQGNEPLPLRPEEVSQIIKRMEADAPRIKVTFRSGERVRIVDGPFNDFRGTVSEIDMERAKVRVMVNFFGRETPVELDFLQVEKA